MPDDSKTTASPKSKPTTRSSIRQSLNLASVGKAFADVISSKDGKEASKNAEKTKDASRRSSALSSLPSAPRASMGDVRPPSQVSLSSKRTSTPDSKTVSRRRVSASHQQSSPDEQPSKSLEATPQPIATIPRTSTLRPRNLNATATSALPKYRPKSVISETAKPPSPTRAGTRRRFSTSDDEKKEQSRPTPVVSPDEKTSRPISPLPHRVALKTNLTNSVHATPPTTPSKPKIVTTTTTPASAAKASPSRPAKISKTGTAITYIPRPLSSSSSSLVANPAVTPKSTTSKSTTPKTSNLKAKLGLSRSAQDKNKSDGQSTTSSPSRNSPSPLARRKNLKSTTPATSSLSGQSGNMSHISEGNSEDEDSDADDVALLLAPVAAMGAPTPAMPRIQVNRQRLAPQTPSRAGLPSRANMSYVSPAPPDSAERSLLLRPPRRETGTQNAMRGSIMSWEQLANDTSVTLGGDEFGRMLSEIPAPFRSGAASPSLSSHFGAPDSPCLSAIDSPGGYGSISQVLLPDVTPSPAAHQSLAHSRFSLSPDTAAVESSTITLLRLQLASAENIANERLLQIQAMEEEFHNVQQAHAHQMEEMQKQALYMESQWRAYDDASQSTEQAVEEAVARSQEQARVSSEILVKAEGLKHEVISSARLASYSWGTLHDSCEAEMDLVREDRALLSVLLAQLDQLSFP